MKTAAELAKARELKPSATRCPHCKVAELARTSGTVTDTDGRTVAVWRCPECDYTEGREGREGSEGAAE